MSIAYTGIAEIWECLAGGCINVMSDCTMRPTVKCPVGLETPSLSLAATPLQEFRKVFKPHACELHAWNASHFEECLAGRRIIIIGDSTMRQAFQSLACLLTDQILSGFFVVSLPYLQECFSLSLCCREHSAAWPLPEEPRGSQWQVAPCHNHDLFPCLPDKWSDPVWLCSCTPYRGVHRMPLSFCPNQLWPPTW